MTRGLCIVMLAVAPACGLGLADDSSGGRDDLPITGAGPWKKLALDGTTALDEPWLFTDSVLEFTEPAIVPASAGGHAVFITYETAELPAGDTAIWRADWLDLRTVPSNFAPVLSADLSWEQGHVGAPAIVTLSDRLVMFYAGGDDIGRAESIDGGHTWAKLVMPVLTGATSPGAAFDGTQWIMAYIEPATHMIALARSIDGVSFTRDPQPLFGPRGDDLSAFDHLAVSSPSLGWLVEGVGRGHWALWYAGQKKAPSGTDPPQLAIGYAASFDGMEWQRLAGNRPIASAPAGAPAVTIAGNHGIMLFDAINGRRNAIGVATTP